MFEEYIRNKTRKNGEQQSNLSKAEQKGLKSLQKRIRNEEILHFTAPILAIFSVDSP